MTTLTGTAFDVETLRRSFAARDADALASLYAEDAEVVRIDRHHPPATPQRLHGRQALHDDVAAVFAQDIAHSLADVVTGEDELAYAVDCVHPDGQRVRCHAIARLRDGRIARETAVSAWDE